jgi:hypothetical protein
MATTVRVPKGLGVRGTKLWRELHEERGEAFPPAETVLVEEACRMVDRLERLNGLLVGDEAAWARVRVPVNAVEDTPLVLVVNDALAEARQQANVLKQIIAALRLPDEAGARPQRRGARGSYQTGGASGAKATVARVTGTVTALDRARAARSS